MGIVCSCTKNRKDGTEREARGPSYQEQVITGANPAKADKMNQMQ